LDVGVSPQIAGTSGHQQSQELRISSEACK
jgi:hypothetical protein